jgi:hypothetical protein
MITFENVIDVIYVVLKRKYSIPENKEMLRLLCKTDELEIHRLFYGLKDKPKTLIAHATERCVDILLDPENTEGCVIQLSYGLDVSSNDTDQMIFINYTPDEDGNINIENIVEDIYGFLYSGFYPASKELLH